MKVSFEFLLRKHRTKNFYIVLYLQLMHRSIFMYVKLREKGNDVLAFTMVCIIAWRSKTLGPELLVKILEQPFFRAHKLRLSLLPLLLFNRKKLRKLFDLLVYSYSMYVCNGRRTKPHQLKSHHSKFYRVNKTPPLNFICNTCLDGHRW
jgi:hypothetical protein